MLPRLLIRLATLLVPVALLLPTAAHAGKGPDGKEIDPETMHYHALAALNGEFAKIVTTAECCDDSVFRI